MLTLIEASNKLNKADELLKFKTDLKNDIKEYLDKKEIYYDKLLIEGSDYLNLKLSVQIEGSHEHVHIKIEDIFKDFCKENNLKITKFENKTEDNSDENHYVCWYYLDVQSLDKVVEEDLIQEDTLEETYSDEELDKMVGKIYNIRKIDKWYRTEGKLYAHTICKNCGREKDVFLSNLVNDPEKYGSCICSDSNVDGKIDYAKSLYSGNRKLKSNTSGYTGVSFVKFYKGQAYNKWRAYIEIDGKRTYLGDFDKKKDAIAARKEAGEKGISWYKANRSKLVRNMRRKTKKYKNSKYRDTARKTINLKTKKKK